MDPATLLLTALLAMFPGTPQRACLVRRQAAIAHDATVSGERHGVPVAVLLSVAFLETFCGCHPGEGGGWGAPAPGPNRSIAGTPDHAAAALARSYRVCGSWQGATERFRCGRCRCGRSLVGYTAPYAIRLSERLSARAGVPLPDHLR